MQSLSPLPLRASPRQSWTPACLCNFLTPSMEARPCYVMWYLAPSSPSTYGNQKAPMCSKIEGKSVTFHSRSHHGCLWPRYSISLDTLGLKAASLCIDAILHMTVLHPVLSGIRDPLSPFKAHHTDCGERLLLLIKALRKVESMSAPFFPKFLQCLEELRYKVKKLSSMTRWHLSFVSCAVLWKPLIDEVWVEELQGEW